MSKAFQRFFFVAAGGTIIPPSTLNATFSSVQDAYFGFYTVNGSTRRFAAIRSALSLRIKGTQADLYCTSGDSTPYRVLVDDQAHTAYSTPTLSGGKIPLFTGLADAEHIVHIFSDNSDTGQSIPTTGTLLSVTGVQPYATKLGTSYMTTDVSFPGIYTGTVNANATYSPATATIPASSVGWGHRNTGSIHFRAKFTEMYVFTYSKTVYVSINGGIMQKVSMEESASANRYWKKIAGITGSLSSYSSVMISGGGGTAGAYAVDQEILGVMLTGDGAEMVAPTGTKRHCTMFGASQVEGAAADSACVDIHMAQPNLPVYALSAGSSGQTLAAAITTIPTWAPKVPYKDICLTSIGTNSPDDANFIPDYKSMVNALLTAGFQKIICRGILDVNSYQAAKNVKIAQAVSELNDSRVVYASIAGWVATTNGANGSIEMPDGNHPTEAGYRTMANKMVADHYSLFI